MMHFPLFQISPLFSKHFQTLWKICNILPFPEKFLDFHRPKFLMTSFLVIDHKFRISPLFSLFQYISPLFLEIYYYSPTLKNFPPVLDKITFFLHTLCISFPPYFDHDAFMHHPMRVLDASVILYLAPERPEKYLYTLPRSGVTGLYFLLWRISLAAALSTDWSPSRLDARPDTTEPTVHATWTSRTPAGQKPHCYQGIF